MQNNFVSKNEEVGLALAGETGEHWSDAFLHRLRGEILLKRDPANTAPGEYRT